MKSPDEQIMTTLGQPNIGKVAFQESSYPAKLKKCWNSECGNAGIQNISLLILILDTSH